MRINALLAVLFSATFVFAVDSPQVKADTETNRPNVITVQRGDTLSKIAKRYETTYKRIFDANQKIKDPDLIYAGDSLRIPGKFEQLKERAIGSPTPSAANRRLSRTRSAPAPAPAPRQEVRQPEPRPQPAAPAPSTSSAGIWDRLANCESSGNWSINTGNGYYGGLQFSLSSWNYVGGSGYPHQASKAEQIKRAEMLQDRQGWGAWPACTAKLGIQ